MPHALSVCLSVEGIYLLRMSEHAPYKVLAHGPSIFAQGLINPCPFRASSSRRAGSLRTMGIELATELRKCPVCGSDPAKRFVVSVVIPVKDDLSLTRCFTAWQRHTRAAVEKIVLDNAATDDSVLVVRSAEANVINYADSRITAASSIGYAALSCPARLIDDLLLLRTPLRFGHILAYLLTRVPASGHRPPLGSNLEMRREPVEDFPPHRGGRPIDGAQFRCATVSGRIS